MKVSSTTRRTKDGRHGCKPKVLTESMWRGKEGEKLTIDSVPPSVQPINFNSRFSSSSIRSTGFSRFSWLGEFCCRTK